MSIQSQLNNNLFTFLPKISETIKNAESFEANQMVDRTIRAALDYPTSVCNMSDTLLNTFQDDLLNIFKHFNWI